MSFSPLASSHFNSFVPLLSTIAPYSIRNLSDPTLNQYELDSKSHTKKTMLKCP